MAVGSAGDRGVAAEDTKQFSVVVPEGWRPLLVLVIVVSLALRSSGA